MVSCGAECLVVMKAVCSVEKKVVKTGPCTVANWVVDEVVNLVVTLGN